MDELLCFRHLVIRLQEILKRNTSATRRTLTGVLALESARGDTKCCNLFKRSGADPSNWPYLIHGSAVVKKASFRKLHDSDDIHKYAVESNVHYSTTTQERASFLPWFYAAFVGGHPALNEPKR